jgi:oxygen-independent coproporphyrinogen-3 oxidase
MAGAPRAITRASIAARDLPFEFMLNALRLRAGFARESFAARTGLAWTTVAATVEDLVGRGLLEVDGEVCRPSALGFAFLNDAVMAFLPQSTGTRELSALSTAS